MTGLEALNKIDNEVLYGVYAQEHYSNEIETIRKELKALEILKQNVKVIIDYGGKYTISMALVFFIDNKKTIYIVDEVIKEQNPEHFKELELLKEVIE
jgi:predicted transcriptional regulator